MDSITIGASNDSETILTFLDVECFPENVRELITENNASAHRGVDGKIVLVDIWGEERETGLKINPDGYVFL